MCGFLLKEWDGRKRSRAFGLIQILAILVSEATKRDFENKMQGQSWAQASSEMLSSRRELPGLGCRTKGHGAFLREGTWQKRLRGLEMDSKPGPQFYKNGGGE